MKPGYYIVGYIGNPERWVIHRELKNNKWGYQPFAFKSDRWAKWDPYDKLNHWNHYHFTKTFKTLSEKWVMDRFFLVMI